MLEEDNQKRLLAFTMDWFVNKPTRFLQFLPWNASTKFCRAALGAPMVTKSLLNRPDNIRMKTEYFDGVPVRVYTPDATLKSSSLNGAVVSIHGGGWCTSRPAHFDGFVWKVVQMTGAIVFAIDYPLAPEHPYPAALDACEKAVQHLLTVGHEKYQINPVNVILMGDSAGGNLAAVLTHRYNKKNNSHLPKIKAQVLLYPATQCINMRTTTYRAFFENKETRGRSVLHPQLLATMVLQYIGIKPTKLNVHNLLLSRQLDFDNDQYHRVKHHFVKLNVPESEQISEKSSGGFGIDREEHLQNVLTNGRNFEKFIYFFARQCEKFMYDPEVSPLISDSFAGLPPAYVLTCGFDCLRDDGILYVQRLAAAGVPVIHEDQPNAPHSVITFTYPDAKKSVLNICSFIDNQLQISL